MVIRGLIPSNVQRWIVDVGAYDGIDGSNSRLLIQEGWKAILIEPMPRSFSRLKVNYGLSPNVQLVNAACGSVTRRMLIYTNESHEQQSSMYPALAKGTSVEVEVRRLTEILIETGCPKDFGVLSVDAEGMDGEVLRGLDFSEFRPAVICIESSYPPAQLIINEILASNEYVLRGHIGADSIWVSANLATTTNLATTADRSFRSFVHCFVHSFVSYIEPGVFRFGETVGKGLVHVDRYIHFFGGYLINGWAIAKSLAPENIMLQFDVGKKREYVQCYRYPRPDVALKLGACVLSGFRALMPTENEPPERVVVIQIDGNRIYRNTVDLPQMDDLRWAVMNPQHYLKWI